MGKVPTALFPGSPGYDFVQLLDQAKSGAFLKAYKTLRGGGAISNVEGDKATAAIAQLDRAQSKQAFDQAINTYRGVIQQGIENQRKIARGEMQPYAVAPTPAPAPPATTPGPSHSRADLEAEARRRGLIK
jgi:hypothetical protein